MENEPEPTLEGTLIERLRAQAEPEGRERNIEMIPLLQADVQSHQSQITELRNKLQDLENQLRSKKLKETREKVWYFAPLLIVIAFTAYLVYRGWAEKPSVSIEYNVGEIIGGLLVGIGALMAGAAYAFRRLRGE